jgi:hypothetical protein
MFQASTAHHQEAGCIYVADDTSNDHQLSLTVVLGVPFAA